MRIQDLRSQFSIFVFLPEIDLSAELKQSFVTSGYETFLFIEQDLLVDRVKQAAPHVIVFSPDILISSLSEFVQAVLEANSEVQFICVSKNSEAEALIEYRDFNFAQVIESGDQFHFRALWLVDSVCEKLALQYRNEALLVRAQDLELRIQQTESRAVTLHQQLSSAQQGPQIEPIFKLFSQTTSKEDLIQSFLKYLAHKKNSKDLRGIYFRYLPSVTSFVATQTLGLDLERSKGVGARMSPEEATEIHLTLQRDQIPTSLQQILKEAFQQSEYTVYPVLQGALIEGVFIVWGEPLGQAERSEFSLFQICFHNFNLDRKLRSLETLDPVTDLQNLQYFRLRLEEEVARSRRLQQPVAVVQLAVDGWAKLGAQRDLILRSVALLVKKTSRINDFACRTGESEITLILPHSPRKGAALRAERLRKAIENHSFANNGIHVTVSLGISEYPSLSRGTEELESSAKLAREFISGKGGNKVCLYKPKENFKPDFEVPI